jgi:anti-sigma factor RsiW
MKCHKVQMKLSAYQDGELEGREVGRIAAHLENCPACRRRLAELERVWQALGDLEELAPDPGFYGQIVEKIHESQERPVWGWRRAFKLLSAQAFPCALMIAAILIGTFLGHLLAGNNLFSWQQNKAARSQEAGEFFALHVFAAAPPGTLGDGYLRMVSRLEERPR